MKFQYGYSEAAAPPLASRYCSANPFTNSKCSRKFGTEDVAAAADKDSAAIRERIVIFCRQTDKTNTAEKDLYSDEFLMSRCSISCVLGRPYVEAVSSFSLSLSRSLALFCLSLAHLSLLCLGGCSIFGSHLCCYTDNETANKFCSKDIYTHTLPLLLSWVGIGRY